MITVGVRREEKQSHPTWNPLLLPTTWEITRFLSFPWAQLYHFTRVLIKGSIYLYSRSCEKHKSHLLPENVFPLSLSRSPHSLWQPQYCLYLHHPGHHNTDRWTRLAVCLSGARLSGFCFWTLHIHTRQVLKTIERSQTNVDSIRSWQVIQLGCKLVLKAARMLSPSSEESLNTAATHVVEVSETGAPWLRQRSPFDILYKKQTVRPGRVHKHSKRKSVETAACQLPCAKRWSRMECSKTFMMTEDGEKSWPNPQIHDCVVFIHLFKVLRYFSLSVWPGESLNKTFLSETKVVQFKK